MRRFVEVLIVPLFLIWMWVTQERGSRVGKSLTVCLGFRHSPMSLLFNDEVGKPIQVCLVANS